MTDPIQTHNIYPPIPIRDYDWTAYRDPERRAGYGPTEREAIVDLLELEWCDDEEGGWTEEERLMFEENSQCAL